MKKYFAKNGMFIVIGIIIVVIFGVGAWKYREMSMQLRDLKTNPSKLQQFAQSDEQTLIATVGKLMVLPTGETPTIAQVSDATKLKDQPFFANAQNGDRVLIYTQARKAILYRPSINKIIDVAPVNIGSTTPTPTAGVTPTAAVTAKATKATTSAGLK